MNKGITLGRFMPLTKGHEFMLRMAWSNCTELTVLLGDSVKDCFTYEQRYGWVHNYLNSLPKVPGKSWRIVRDQDYDRPTNSDTTGTITDKAFWDFWMDQNQVYLWDADRVFTSDRYGAEIADQINKRWPRAGTAKATWFPIDPDRELFPISATMVRTAPFANFHMVSDWAKADIGLTVAVMGAESTGKSTMVKKLAKHFNTTYAPEWGRIISEARPDLTMEDFNNIVWMQQSMIWSAQKSGEFVSFTDTEAIVTSMFAPIYLGEACSQADRVASGQSTIDHYLVLAPTVPRVQDGTRVLDDEGRMKFHHNLLERLDALEKPYTVITEADYDVRFTEAVKLVERWAYEKAATFLKPWRQTVVDAVMGNLI